MNYSNWILIRFFSSMTTGIVLIVIIALMLAIEATWSVSIHNTVPFLVVQSMLMFSLLLVVCRAIQRLRQSFNIRNVSFLLNHLGILVVLCGALFGSPFVERSKVMLYEGEVTNVAYSNDHKVKTLPFSIALNDYETTFYDDGIHPKQFTSHLTVNGNEMLTSVNNPCSFGGYTIFQDGADMQDGLYSILQFVRDPWLLVVYVGMALLACGAYLLMFGRLRLKVTIPLLIILTIQFTAFSVKKIEFETLMPALRSWWFAPHILLYMMAYSLMFIGIVAWIVEKRKERNAPLYVKHDDYSVSTNLVRSSSALLILGMLTGSVWARQAWADYWAWDPKENWAAVTWLVSLLFLHYTDKRSRMAFIILLIAFLALQITWYGVDYLPSAAYSLHTYK